MTSTTLPRTKKNPRPVLSPNTPYDELPEWLTLREAADVLGYCYWTVYMMVTDKTRAPQDQLPSKRIGKRFYVPKEVFQKREEYLEVQAAKLPFDAFNTPKRRTSVQHEVEVQR